jgi:hypothetical protein
VLVARFSQGLTPSAEVAAAVPGAGAARRPSGAPTPRPRSGPAPGGRRSAPATGPWWPTLAARGLVEEVPGRTAGEYRREVGRAVPAAAADFAGATELFEVAWYGRSDTGAARRPTCATCPTASSGGPGMSGRPAGRSGSGGWRSGRSAVGGRCRGSRWCSGWRWWWRSRAAGRRATRWTRRRRAARDQGLVEVLRELGGRVRVSADRPGPGPRPRCCSATT